jgi:hypothetical protein
MGARPAPGVARVCRYSRTSRHPCRSRAGEGQRHVRQSADPHRWRGPSRGGSHSIAGRRGGRGCASASAPARPSAPRPPISCRTWRLIDSFTSARRRGDDLDRPEGPSASAGIARYLSRIANQSDHPSSTRRSTQPIRRHADWASARRQDLACLPQTRQPVVRGC